MSQTRATPEAPEARPMVIPEGVTLEHRIGPLTGQPLYRVAGFEMPWTSSEAQAVEVYGRLKEAYDSGYFSAASKK